MIDGLDPGAEEPVELVEGVGGLGLDLDEELDPHRLEKSLDLPPALGAPWLGVHQGDAEARQRPQELARHHGRAVIEVAATGDPSCFEGRAQCGLEAHRVFGEPEAIADERPGVVVDEGEQVGLAPRDHRAVQCVTGPQVTGCFCLEAAEGLRRRSVGPGVEPEAGEVALQRA